MKLVDTLPNLLDSEEKLQLQEEFTDYQFTILNELPKCHCLEIDFATSWGELSNLHDFVFKQVDYFIKTGKTYVGLTKQQCRQ